MKKIRKRFKRVEEDCADLTRTDLRRKYQSEYNSWKNRKSELKNHGSEIHPDFADFADFLKYMGPKPDPSYTLDRIDNDDPEYAPGKVRWASKTTQTRNRSNTVKMLDGDREVSAAEIAEETGVPISTIRRRIENGWPYRDVVSGRRPSSGSWHSPRNARAREVVVQEERWPWLGPKSALEWEGYYNEDMPDCSRFEYFENGVKDYLADAEFAIADEAPLLKAKLEGRLSDEKIVWRLDYRTSDVPLSQITEKRMARLIKERDAHQAVLEKLETYRRRRGEFHHVPDWPDDWD